MDELEQRLKADARRVVAESSPELQTRIDAGLQAAGEMRSVARERPPQSGSLWWISSLTGLTAAAVIILILNWNRVTEPVSTATPATAATTGQPAVHDWPALPQIPLQVESADLTQPLQQELIDLQSDLEKAKKAVEEDLPLSF